MATTHTTWSAPTGNQATLISTGLDDLVNGNLILSAAYDNSTALDLYADFECDLCYATGPPAAGVKVGELYLLPSVDGTNYPEGSATITPQQALLIGAVESRNSSTTALERLSVPGVPIPPGKFKVAFKNTSAVTLKSSATAKAVQMRPYQMQNA